MHHIRRSAISALAVIGLLSGCAGNVPDTPPPSPAAAEATPSAVFVNPGDKGLFYITLPDGYELLCVYVDGGYEGGPSCDWEGHQAWLVERAAK